MKLAQLLQGITPERLIPDGDAALESVEIRAVQEDSRRVGPGDLFVAVPGQAADGHDFVRAAVTQGAAAVVLERPLADLPVPQIKVRSAAEALALLAHNESGRPGEALRLCAVTGTNGKTTTNFLLEALLREAGEEPGLLGTVCYRVAGHSQAAPLTTPGPLLLARTLRRMRDAGATAVTLEASSHALAQGRLRGLRFAVSAFTNLTQDHLDFHGDMERYLAAKALLFTEHLAPGGAAVICVDGAAGRRLAALLRGRDARVLTVSTGAEPADLRVEAARLRLSGTEATLATPAGPLMLHSPLPGRFNLENLVVAAGVGLALGLAPAAIAAALLRMGGVPGRMERPVPGAAVFVDYAHTPDALERALAALRELREAPQAGRVLVVFGCGGDRDRGKRPLMGQAAARHADLVLCTADNPRTEDPAAIIAMTTAGLDPADLPRLHAGALATAPRGLLEEPDRRRAIALAVAASRPGDAVLVAGKGHEDYQIIGATKHHLDDREEVRAALGAGVPLGRILAATGGRLVQGEARSFSAVTMDSRQAGPGSLFVALLGGQRDGHEFLPQAAAAGAAGALVQRGRYAGGLPASMVVVEVEDTVAALGQIGRAQREAPEISGDLQVIGLTGSVGKTSTKELLYAVLRAHAGDAVLKTEGNLNNHLGVPLTLARLRPGHRYAVVEMGMSGLQEIDYLARLARPQLGVITNVAPVHLEQLGSLANIGRAKGELWAAMATGGAAVYLSGPEHPAVAEAARAYAGHLQAWRAEVGPGAGDGEVAARVDLLEQGEAGLVLRVHLPRSGEAFRARVPLLGAQHADNAALAIAAAVALGIPAATIAAGLGQALAEKHRGQVLRRGGRSLLDDCYNASPRSVDAALRTLVALRGEGRALMVLGDMLELGADEGALHEEVGRQAAAAGLALLCTLGPRAERAAAAAQAAGGAAYAARSPEDAARAVVAHSGPGDWVLIKGSRGMRLERVLDELARLLPDGQA